MVSYFRYLFLALFVHSYDVLGLQICWIRNSRVRAHNILNRGTSLYAVQPSERLASSEKDTVDGVNRQEITPYYQRPEQDSLYQRGFVTIGFCTLVFASMSPVMHAAMDGTTAIPVLLLNATVSCVALMTLLLTGPWLESSIPSSVTLQENDSDSSTSARAGMELGFWKFLGTTANLYGLALTSASHGAFLIQLTTLIVPIVQSIQGVPIPRRIQTAIALALTGVALFTHDSNGISTTETLLESNNSLLGDSLCVLAAIFYATYDLRLYQWGKQVPPRQLMLGKLVTQALCAVVLCGTLGSHESIAFLTQDNPSTSQIAMIVWSGIMVNAVVPFLQVGGQQAIGPTVSQTIYATQPLLAAFMSYIWLDEKFGFTGVVGGIAFCGALLIAGTSTDQTTNNN